MKAKSLLLAVLLSTSLLTFASEPGKFKVAVVNQKELGIFKVIYEGENKGNVKLNVLSIDGSIVYHETIKNIDGFVLPLNFNGMAQGEYTVEIVDNTGKISQKLSYLTGAASASNVRISKIEEGKYLFAIASKGSDEVNVKIYDGASELVHNETLTINGDLGLVYNLQKISGEPTFAITDKAGIVHRTK